MSISHISTWIVCSFHGQGCNTKLFNYSPLLVMLLLYQWSFGFSMYHYPPICLPIIWQCHPLFFSPCYFFNLGHIFHVCLTWFNLPFCFKRGEHVLQRGVLTFPGPAQGSQLAKAQLSMTSACIVSTREGARKHALVIHWWIQVVQWPTREMTHRQTACFDGFDMNFTGFLLGSVCVCAYCKAGVGRVMTRLRA